MARSDTALRPPPQERFRSVMPPGEGLPQQAATKLDLTTVEHRFNNAVAMAIVKVSVGLG